MANTHGRRGLPLMVRSGRKRTKPSWPLMELWGLHRKPIEADGNCLFRALSDQLYNDTEKHNEIRQKVVQYLRSNREHFEPFVLANVGEDLIRSQPTTRSSRSWKSNVENDAFDVYLDNMAKSKTWGGDIEITAFCEVYDRDVLIHRPTDAERPFTVIVNSKRAAGEPEIFVHISYGDEETFAHYESVQPSKPPSDTVPTRTNTDCPSTVTASRCNVPSKPLSHIPEFTRALDGKQKEGSNLNPREIHKLLQESRTELDRTFSRMIDMDRERSSSASSTSRRSSSSKRSRKEDEEDSDRTSKRAARRVSLRNKTFAFVTTTPPPSSLCGTEITFRIRVDSPPYTPSQGRTVAKPGMEQNEEAVAAGKPGGQEVKPQQGGRSTKSDAKNALR